MKCFYCLKGHTSRCEKSLLFGSAALDGAQAEYVRVPWADGTIVKAPPSLSDNALILMADIWPTGFFGATSAFDLLRDTAASDANVAVIGCGPVGLCAIIAALEFRPRTLFAIDSVQSRLDCAKQLGAEPLNFQTDGEGLKARIAEATGGRGVDAVVEVVGLSPALRTAFDIVRPFGVIASIGVHNGEVSEGTPSFLEPSPFLFSRFRPLIRFAYRLGLTSDDIDPFQWKGGIRVRYSEALRALVRVC